MNFEMLFGRSSPIHTLSECEDSPSFEGRLSLFGFNADKIFLLRKLDLVSSTYHRHLFNNDEIVFLEEMNRKLDIPRVYFLTGKNDEDVMEKFISLGYYEEIPQHCYTS